MREKSCGNVLSDIVQLSCAALGRAPSAPSYYLVELIKSRDTRRLYFLVG
ncbi:unnamed protein product [Ectocarpus sp. CCAP 1310/34]|nr:unnamed protein product [Ectocarpus sp. CCAP 1310/34]